MNSDNPIHTRNKNRQLDLIHNIMKNPKNKKVNLNLNFPDTKAVKYPAIINSRQDHILPTHVLNPQDLPECIQINQLERLQKRDYDIDMTF